MKMTQLPEALRELADSPTLEATLSWDGVTYEVGPSEKYVPLSPGHRAILTRDELVQWCGGDVSDLGPAVEWVRTEQSTWYSAAADVSGIEMTASDGTRDRLIGVWESLFESYPETTVLCDVPILRNAQDQRGTGLD